MQINIFQVQRLLDNLGHSPGAIDGIWGARSQAALDAALADYQSSFDELVAQVPPLGYIRATKGEAMQLSKDFLSTEFDCYGSGCCTVTVINMELVEILQKVRDHFGVPVRISSGYRCPTHNGATKNAAKASLHTTGDAADIVVVGVAPRKVAQYLESIGILGIGLYETASDGYFVHVDTRKVKAYWYGQAQKPKTTFIAA